MYCGLYLRHLCYPENNICQSASIHLVAVAKTHLELKDWMNSMVVDDYKEDGPDLSTGGNRVYTKSFARGSQLEWYYLPETLELNSDKQTGFFDVQTYEQFQEQLHLSVQDKIRMIHEAARHELDHYRNNIEPKMVSYDPTARSTVRRPN